MITQVAYVKTGSLMTISFVTAAYFSFGVMSPITSAFALSDVKENSLWLSEIYSIFLIPQDTFQSRLLWETFTWMCPYISSLVNTSCYHHEQMVYIPAALKNQKREWRGDKLILKPKSFVIMKHLLIIYLYVVLD